MEKSIYLRGAKCTIENYRSGKVMLDYKYLIILLIKKIVIQ
jgi:hypothetical protein